MKWNFVEEKIFSVQEEHVASTFRHRGLGAVEVIYDVSWECPKERVAVQLYCGPRMKDHCLVDRVDARQTAEKMYYQFVRHKISNTHVALLKGSKIEIINIDNGTSVELTTHAIDKLDTLKRKHL